MLNRRLFLFSKPKLASLIGLSLSCVAFAAHADSVLTLDQAVDQFHQSPRFEKSRSATEEAHWKKVEAFSKFLPNLSFEADHLFDKKYAVFDIPGFPEIAQIFPTTTYTVAANWVIFDGFANVNRFDAARSMEEASKKEFNWTEFQGEREVILAFYRSLAAKVLKGVADANYKTLQEHLSDTKLFRKSGISTKFEVLQVEVQASAAKSEVRNAEDTISVSELRLGELLGKDLKGATLQGKLPELDESAIASFQDKIDDRSDIQALEKRVTGMSQLSSAADKHWVPKVALMGEFQKYNNVDDSFSFESTKLRDMYQVGVSLSWNYDGILGPSARAGASSEERYQAQKGLEMSRLKAENDVEFWRRKYLYSVSVFKDRREDIAKAEEAVRLAQEGRRAGTRTNTELLDVEADLFRARAQSVSAQVGAVEALLNLELSTGKKIHEFR